MNKHLLKRDNTMITVARVEGTDSGYVIGEKSDGSYGMNEHVKFHWINRHE